MILSITDKTTGLGFQPNQITSTHDIKLTLDGIDIGRHVMKVSIDLDASKGTPEITLKVLSNNVPQDISGKTYIECDNVVFECIRVLQK